MKALLIGSEPSRMTRLRRTYASLKRLGVTVEVFAPYEEPRGSPRILKGLIRYLVIMIQLLLKRADIYHLYNVPDVLGLPLSIKKGVFIYDVRSPWFSSVLETTGNRMLSKIAHIIERLVTRSADIVLTANTPLAQRAYNWGARKVAVLPNYPTNDFDSTADPRILKTKLGLEGSKVVLYLGKLSKLEGIEIVKKVIQKISSERTDTKFLVVGDGPSMPNLQAHIRKHGVEDIVVMTGWVDYRQVPKYIDLADICILPREWTTFSKYTTPENILKINEYLALRKPVVVPNMGGFVDAEFPVIAVEPAQIPDAVLDYLKNPIEFPDYLAPRWSVSHELLRKVYRYFNAI